MADICVWVVLDADHDPIGVYATHVGALKGYISYIRDREPQMLDNALSCYELNEPLNWDDPQVIDSIDDLCSEEHYSIIKTHFFQ